MFTTSAIARLARHAHALSEGSGGGYTEYAHAPSAQRYVVGGHCPARILPVGTPVGAIRAAIRALLERPGAQTAETMGVWEYNGSLYIDLGSTFLYLNDALYAAQNRGELAIYDRTDARCITAPAPRTLAPCYCDSAYHPEGC